MGTLLKKKATLKTIEPMIPMERCCEFGVNAMRFATSLVRDTYEQRKELNNEWLSTELAKHMMMLASTEDYYDCLPGDIGFCYPPRIEGGHDYNLHLKANSGNTMDTFDTIRCRIGFRFKENCCHIVRTSTIQSSEKVKEAVKFGKKVYDEVIKNLKDGRELCKVYRMVQSFAEREDKVLAKHLENELGFELSSTCKKKEAIINSNSKAIAKKNMIFVIKINFVGLEVGGKKFNFRFCDTVRITKNYMADILTDLRKREKGNRMCVK